eukprot:3320537-Prymnesium_polylepis.1
MRGVVHRGLGLALAPHLAPRIGGGGGLINCSTPLFGLTREQLEPPRPRRAHELTQPKESHLGHPAQRRARRRCEVEPRVPLVLCSQRDVAQSVHVHIPLVAQRRC